MMNTPQTKNDASMTAEKIMLNDKIALRKLSDLMDAALAHIAWQLGLEELKTGNIRFDGDGLSAKITVNAKAQSQDGKTKEERDFAKYHEMFGIPASALGSTILHGGTSVEILGLQPNRRKFPVLVRDKRNGKRFLITTEEVIKKTGGQIGGLTLVEPPARS